MRRRIIPLLASAIALSGALLTGHGAAVAAPVKPDVVNGELGPSPDFGFLVALGDRATFEALGMDRAQFCGGTLVTASLVVTAAHCVADARATDLVVGSPGDSGALSSPTMRSSNVTGIKVFPRYDAQSQSGDVAVLTLATPLRGVPTILPVTPEEAQSIAAARQTVTVAGWGAINNSKPWRFTDVYRIGNLVVFPDSACGGGQPFTIDGVKFTGYGPNDVNPKTMVCAEGVSRGEPVDSCVGDSGGPLVGGTGDARRLVGLVSWGLNDCAVRAGAGVYTRLSAFTDFLKSAGVPFVPAPTTGVQPPTVARVSSTATSLTVTVRASAEGDQPDTYSVLATDPDGLVTSCSVAAPARPATASCTVMGLSAHVTYQLTAIAIAGDHTSTPSAAVTAQPVGSPGRPRIVEARAYRGGLASFIVQNIDGNGSAITASSVRCSAADLPRRSATIETGGVAIVSRLRAGRTYSCVAVVANEYGRSTSRPAVLTAK